MNDPLPDEDLKSLFARQRAADQERAPAFHAMRTHALATASKAPSTSTPFAWRWALSGAAALALALVTVLSLHHPGKPPTASREALTRELERIDLALQKDLAAHDSLTAWQSPTDFLLNPTRNEHTP